MQIKIKTGLPERRRPGKPATAGSELDSGLQERSVLIGNGLYARAKPQPLSLIEWYRKLQAECSHVKRDPRGNCYDCGQREVA